MNERINELMLEVGFAGYGEESGFYNIPVPAFNNRMERFAQLIVEECGAVALNIGCGDIEDELLKHFGVAE